MALNPTPTFQLQPSANQVALASNYLTNADFTWLQQYLPDTYEKEFERYGNRSVASFLRMVGAEMPSNSDLIKWAEQGRLHIKYTSVGTGASAIVTTLLYSK
jgi:putative flippase GtrA